MNENERFETLKSMTQDMKEKMDKEAFRLYPTFVQDREIFRRGVEWGMNAVIDKDKAEAMEFEHDNLSTELKPFNQIDEEKHWQGIKEQAAIAAMQGTMTILGSSDRGAFRDIVVEGYSGTEKTYPKEIAEFAVACAGALIEELKKK